MTMNWYLNYNLKLTVTYNHKKIGFRSSQSN